MWTIIPESIKELHQIFKNNDKSLFVVGGAVRDFLNNEKPKDFDICTDATPTEVIAILKDFRTNLQGAAFGVVVVYTDDEPMGFEIATFREDVYGDKLGETRNPDVKFTTIDKDVLRRDLTFNSLFFDLEKREIVDLVGGIKDIQNKVTRFVGEPDLRIEEDPLRILRLVRFSTRYNFSIHKKSLKSIKRNAGKLSIITKERIWEEIKKAHKQSKNFSRYMKNLINFGIFDVIFDVNINQEVVECSSLELYIANLFRPNSTVGLLDKMKFDFKMEHDFARKVVFLLDLITIEPSNIQTLFKKSVGVSIDTITEWYDIIGFITPEHKAFLKYTPIANATELMNQGFQGKNLGAKISEIEIAHFKELIVC
jgi:tRNA nucleotidyltransferase/poly(A) polymerase